jgi:hypothetical protein
MDDDTKQKILLAMSAIEAGQHDAAFIILKDMIEQQEVIDWKTLVEVARG